MPPWAFFNRHVCTSGLMSLDKRKTERDKSKKKTERRKERNRRKQRERERGLDRENRK
jgi:hypothetical protein